MWITLKKFIIIFWQSIAGAEKWVIAMNNYAELTTTEKRKVLHDLIEKLIATAY